MASGAATAAGVGNIEPTLGTVVDPKLPEGVIDLVILVDVYHELQEPRAMLEKVKEALAPGGRVALLEYRAEQEDDVMPAFSA